MINGKLVSSSEISYAEPQIRESIGTRQKFQSYSGAADTRTRDEIFRYNR